ncbi:MAG: LemA family protein, partial [bacterium]|nr:LemA family protein [bacterium]
MLIITSILIALTASVTIVYNLLVKGRQRVKSAWSQIDVQLKRRHDLIPNLTAVARGYMEHERTTLEGVASARQAAAGASGVREQAAAENVLTGALRSFWAVAESYPALKADTVMLSLQEELVSTENRIAFARQYYN